MRVKCIVSYDGTRFHGFQVQNNERTIQGEIQKAIKKINEEETVIHASGRTDAKVRKRNGKEPLITFYLMIFTF